MKKTLLTGAVLSACLAMTSADTLAKDDRDNNKGSKACKNLPSHSELKASLSAVVAGGENAGLGNDMWGTVVNRDGVVCAVVFTGSDRGSQWLGSRVISSQKANTANAFSLENAFPNVAGVGRSLSSGNLYGLVLPGGSLFGLQFSNPVDPAVAYDGNPKKFGKPNDPMVGEKIGGVNVFGGGLALYDEFGAMVGGIGVSGDTACTDHIIAWKTRDALGLDNIPGGVGDGFANDNLILGNPPTANTFEHPSCGFDEDPIIENLATDFPVGE